MARKQINISRRMLFTWLLLGGFILLLSPQNFTNKFQLAFASVFHWPLSLGRSISLSTQAVQKQDDVVPRKDYDRLRIHLANIEARLEQASLKIDELSGIRNRYPLSGAAFVVADVITTNISMQRCELVINRGQEDGLLPGYCILADNSIIGIITDVDNRMARVRLITDPESNVKVKVGGLDRLMYGCGGNLAKVPMIKNKVEKGERIIASERAGYLDVPMVIGKVVKYESNSQSALLWDITVEPVCDLEKLTRVTVVVMNPK